MNSAAINFVYIAQVKFIVLGISGGTGVLRHDGPNRKHSIKITRQDNRIHLDK